MTHAETSVHTPDDDSTKAARPAWLWGVLLILFIAWLVLLPGNYAMRQLADASWLGRWWFLSTAALSVAAWSIWLAALKPTRRFAMGVAIGITMALVADIYGILPQTIRPVPPLAVSLLAFALGHLGFLYACWNAGSRLHLLKPVIWVASIVIWVTVGVVFWYAITTGDCRLLEFRWPALAYTVLLGITVGAFSALGIQDRRFRLMAGGAVLFLASDLLLAVGLFRGGPGGITDIAWLIYGIGEMLIVYGAVFYTSNASITISRNGVAAAVMMCAVLAPSVAHAENWPALPAENGTITVPAQEWPRKPGMREINAYVYYPGGKLDSVGTGTGLMLSLHNWGGTKDIGTADPQQLADRFNVVAICVDYLQSGPWNRTGAAYDFGYLQAIDALRGLYAVYDGLMKLQKPFDHGRIFAAGGSGGGNVTLMVNKLAPRTFTCIIDMCGMAKLSDDIALGLPGRTHLSAGYSRDPASPDFLRKDAQEIRYVGNPAHLDVMKQLGNQAKIVIVHGVDDASCPVADAQEMAANMRTAGLDVEPHFLTKADVDGQAVKTTGHSLGDRTRIVFRFAGRYLSPDGPDTLARRTPTDFDRRDQVHYPTSGGDYVISYAKGYPIAQFQASR